MTLPFLLNHTVSNWHFSYSLMMYGTGSLAVKIKMGSAEVYTLPDGIQGCSTHFCKAKLAVTFFLISIKMMKGGESISLVNFESLSLWIIWEKFGNTNPRVGNYIKKHSKFKISQVYTQCNVITCLKCP